MYAKGKGPLVNLKDRLMEEQWSQEFQVEDRLYNYCKHMKDLSVLEVAEGTSWRCQALCRTLKVDRS